MARSNASVAVLALLLALVGAGCGGIASVPGHGGAGGTGGQSGLDGGVDADAGLDAGWTQCSAPDGLRLCKGAHDCPSGKDCPCYGADDAGPGMCAVWFDQGDNGRYAGDGCPLCRDGDICAAWYGGPYIAFYCAPYQAGILYAQNGAPDRVRYADLGLWTGDPLPLPTTCPDLGFPICGGNCGGCPSGICAGRSPLHPYGLCVPLHLPGGDPNVCGVGSGGACPSGWGCFTYKVQAAAQKVADQQAFCLPTDYCKNAAANLPGGGKCSAP